MPTRKTFALTAAIVAQVSDPRERAAMAARFAEEYARQNPRFSRSRFLAACGVREN